MDALFLPPEGPVWPPRKPIISFKTRMQLTQVQTSDKAHIERMNSELGHRYSLTHAPLDDKIIGWVNTRFFCNVLTADELTVGFPVIVLMILDPVYAGRVRWQEVCWDMKYTVNVEKNFALLRALWEDVHMDKARHLRDGDMHNKLDQMLKAPMSEKTAFLWCLLRWFEARMARTPFDAVRRRAEVARECRRFGITPAFPQWMPHGPEAREHEDELVPAAPGAARLGWSPMAPASNGFVKMPEFKRLIWFLGSKELPGM